MRRFGPCADKNHVNVAHEIQQWLAILKPAPATRAALCYQQRTLKRVAANPKKTGTIALNRGGLGKVNFVQMQGFASLTRLGVLLTEHTMSKHAHPINVSRVSK